MTTDKNRGAAGASPSIELHVEEVVLHGFAEIERRPIGEAFERELTRLAAKSGAPLAAWGNHEIEHLNWGTFELTPDSTADAIGVHLAARLYGGKQQ
jgi:hypothetical protein